MHAARPADGHAAAERRPLAQRDDLDARLNWLTAFDAEAERRARRFRTPREEREMLMMLRPVGVERAFALFGTLLGTLPPAAIFIRLFGDWPSREPGWGGLGLAAMCLAMNVICAVVGRRMGRAVGHPMIAGAERRSWARTLLVALLASFVWAAATGAARRSSPPSSSLGRCSTGS